MHTTRYLFLFLLLFWLFLLLLYLHFLCLFFIYFCFCFCFVYTFEFTFEFTFVFTFLFHYCFTKFYSLCDTVQINFLPWVNTNVLYQPAIPRLNFNTDLWRERYNQDRQAPAVSERGAVWEVDVQRIVDILHHGCVTSRFSS